jgi:CrcB protein
MRHVIYIALGGTTGTLARYFLSRHINSTSGSMFPFGTLAVNAAGCLIIGFLFDIFENIIVDPSVRAMLTIGFLGGFTTFSSYAMETVNLARNGEIKYGLLYMAANNFLGLACVVAGIYASRILLKTLR